ncbi:30S ribosomal protein S20 [Sediminispirochaeta smaragdinae]|uniref:Small ribosomal subunit protein bS20 n=1 Tax=Sediminispirochaeta smaragdinae (strain DSM 11293 / JCM 15392 / SEBR 4228) TaxID=573413 RepID=E1R5F6_SEDSS|nr:30S ribosomal protein S20 [Sediminispirochaeta smaragdinae]ADK82284.1 ribosomal protein S20 [Sediminispirochaeta smaragdinae DSM 11293]
MPSNKSAEKRHRQNQKRRLRNRIMKSGVHTARRKVDAALKSGDKEAAEQAYKAYVQLIDKAARKSVLHKNNAARKKSRLSKALNALQVQ